VERTESEPKVRRKRERERPRGIAPGSALSDDDGDAHRPAAAGGMRGRDGQQATLAHPTDEAAEAQAGTDADVHGFTQRAKMTSVALSPRRRMRTLNR
jgi:hypothetical protein